MNRWRMLIFLIVCLSVFVYVPATDQKPTNGYQALLNLMQSGKFTLEQSIQFLMDEVPLMVNHTGFKPVTSTV